MKHECGEVIGLVWPEGNDLGEFSVRGHFSDEEAREILLDSGELESLAHEDAEDKTWQRDQVAGAAVEQLFARWSMEADPDGIDEHRHVLRHYRNGGAGRFRVTRITLFPRSEKTKPMTHITPERMALLRTMAHYPSAAIGDGVSITREELAALLETDQGAWRCTGCGVIYPDTIDPSMYEDCSCGAGAESAERLRITVRPDTHQHGDSANALDGGEEGR